LGGVGLTREFPPGYSQRGGLNGVGVGVEGGGRPCEEGSEEEGLAFAGGGGGLLDGRDNLG